MAIDLGLILMIATIVTGGIIVIDKFYLTAEGSQTHPETRQPGIIDFSYSFFPILLVIFLVRSFGYEPFRIPSESMQPTLAAGDFILVEKFHYGLKLPGFETAFWENNPIKRGDLVVFRYPLNPQEFYIKRVIGLPGETIQLAGNSIRILASCTQTEDCQQQLILTNQLQATADPVQDNELATYQETFEAKHYQVLYNTQSPKFKPTEQYQVPENSYFMLGDNRDKSNDSRVWGFVEHKQLVGRAILVWMHLEFEHDTWHWLPTGMRFSDARLLQ